MCFGYWPLADIANRCRVCLAEGNDAEGYSVMNVITGPEQGEEFFSCDVSDEALEIAAGTRKEFEDGYTLMYCTSVDCALLS
jgi:hypothetical protein